MRRTDAPPTIKDVAREAGVSLGTVSKVINGIPVGESYRRRVEQAIKDLGYHVNTYARGLKTNKTNCVALVMPSLHHPFFAHLTDELTACLMRVWAPTLQEAGYEAVRPTVTVYSTPISTPCGDMPMENAAYCMVDQQIYYASDLTDIIPKDLSNVPHTADAVMAHEFGHAIQARTGILY